MSTWGDGSTEHLAIKITMSDDTRLTLRQRNFTEEEPLQFVIFNAEAGGDKLYDKKQENRFLARGIVKEMMLHVDYSVEEEGGEKAYNVNTAYACRTRIKE